MMKQVRRRVYAAEQGADTQLEDKIKDVEDDFDFLISGLEALNRYGDRRSAIEIVDRLSQAIMSLESELGDKL